MKKKRISRTTPMSTHEASSGRSEHQPEDKMRCRHKNADPTETMQIKSIFLLATESETNLCQRMLYTHQVQMFWNGCAF